MIGANWHKFEKSNSDMIRDEMIIYLYVFGTFMKGGIGGKVSGRLIITEEKSRSKEWDAKMFKQLSQSN